MRRLYDVTATLGTGARATFLTTDNYTAARRFAADRNLWVAKLRNRIGVMNRRMRDDGQRMTLPVMIWRAFTVQERVIND